MTTLLLDVGNSRLKWNTLAGLEQGGASQYFNWREQSPQDYFAQYWNSMPQLSNVWISSVAGKEMDEALRQTFEQQGLSPRFAYTQEKYNEIRNGYRETLQLGVDRWLALIAAPPLARKISAQTHCHSCIIDCGTAITLDVIDPGGQHLGGLIAPGLGLMRQSLERAPGVSLQGEFDVNLLARNTNDGVYSGTLSMAVAFVDTTVMRLEQQLKQPLVNILTGGDGEELKRHLQGNYHFDADLVLQGLALFASHSLI